MEKRMVVPEGGEKGGVVGVSSSSKGGDTGMVRELMDVIMTVGSYSGYRRTQRKECLNLVRRLKFLMPLLEEIRELDASVLRVSCNGLTNLRKAFFAARKLLKHCNDGSKIYLALESEAVTGRFHGVYDKLNQALDDLSYNELGISVEVKEQVELMRMQLKRARRRADTQDMELAMDIMVVLSKKDDRNNLQTYERESIQKWLNSNHRTCPKTGQVLDHLSLAPNYALRNLILQWCEKNNFELPKKDACVGSGGSSSAELTEEISSLVQHLSSCQPEVRRVAIMKIRMLSKENPDNRILIANVGGIPPLVQLLYYPDSKIQEHTVTALLNLSLDEANKRLIAREGAIPAIIEILQSGTDEARENSAAALFSLSMLDENKVLVGGFNGILPLVDLLQNGTTRGKKDAATALFNLSLNQTNKSRAIKAGIIPPLLHLLEDKNLGMIDEALSILLLLATHPEGRKKIGQISFVETLVEIIRKGTPKNQECATSVLLELGLNNSSVILAALQFGVYEHLREIARCGTSRAQRKANSLLQHMSKCEHLP
ncbi:U-box domain-containing protein 15-like [Carica papaya]|uniref:U-box domain-containing protein 15-like n=1 Tax=Carica papaya TaxID=3649 RepID=UPI000B8CCD69|nr:U-box domain-containing protein 15-like [Carica papaya]